MNNHQAGSGGMQLLMVITIIGAISVVAVPKYNAFMDKAKITEAFTLAGESKRKLSQYYMVNNRFPRTAREAEPMKTQTLSPPEFVREMVVQPNEQDHDVVVKVYLKPGVVDNTAGGEQFIYIAGDKTADADSAVKWSCGASGVNADILPENCKG